MLPPLTLPLYHQTNVVVHQFKAPRFVIPFEKARLTIHLSYHGDYHYNSVRAEGDNGDGPAMPITLLKPAPEQARDGPPAKGENYCNVSNRKEGDRSRTLDPVCVLKPPSSKSASKMGQQPNGRYFIRGTPLAPFVYSSRHRDEPATWSWHCVGSQRAYVRLRFGNDKIAMEWSSYNGITCGSWVPDRDVLFFVRRGRNRAGGTGPFCRTCNICRSAAIGDPR